MKAFAAQNRAHYSHEIYERSRWRVMVLVDLQGPKTITNDAELIVADLVRAKLLRDTDKLIYRDSDGRWDEISHVLGRFDGFCPLNAPNLGVALVVLEAQESV